MLKYLLFYRITAKFIFLTLLIHSINVSWSQIIPDDHRMTGDSGILRGMPDVPAKRTTIDHMNKNSSVGSSSLFLNGFFPIGAFGQPTFLFDTWKARGVNTMVGYSGESAYTTDSWGYLAESKGLKTIRQPGPNPAAYSGDTNLLAWDQMDEPDAAGQGMNNLPGEAANYAMLKQADPNHPVFLNFAGPDVMTAIDGPKPDWCNEANGWCSLTSNHIDYINDALDWIGNDIYPVTGFLPYEINRYDLTYLAAPIERIRSWTDKPQFCCIESSDQKSFPSPSTSRGVTPSELRAEIWLAIIHGVRGIVYFPDAFSGPWQWTWWDGTTSDVAAEMTTQDSIVTALALVLQGDINPAGLGISLPSPLQACWRNAPDGKYFIVVNPVNSTISGAAITLNGVDSFVITMVYNESRSVPLSSGNLIDTFGPFAVHIYVVSKDAQINTPSNSGLLSRYFLYQNYPNPFNPSTIIRYHVPSTEIIKIIIYDMLGRQVRILFDGIVPAGDQNVQWDGKDIQGNKVDSGVYFYQLKTESGFIKTQKMIYLK